jgi:cyclohexa-1,5-dienecarbonyl-CoA hydratase
MPAYQTIRLKKTRKQAEITLNHPPLNIIGFEMMSELSEALGECGDWRILILSTALDHFSTGVDVRIHTPDLAGKMLDEFHAIIRKLYSLPCLTLCAIRGYALGGALELAICCDVVAAHKSSVLGFPEITIGCFPPVAAVLLPRLIGGNANALLYGGETISAQKAQEIGLVHALYEDDLQNVVDHYASLSSDALRSIKRVLRNTADFDFNDALSESERIYKDELLKSPDVVEGVKAFLEKRKPRFS